MAAGDLPSGVVTFLFTDIEGSTRVLQQLGATAYKGVLDEHRRLLRSVFDDHQGHELGTEGDSFFVVFSTPDDALCACVAAQRALERHPWPGDTAIRVRMGLHSGVAEPTDDGRYVALAVHQAARVAAAGHGGQVLLSSTTAQLLGDRCRPAAELVDLGRYRLKDFDDPETIYQVRSDGLRDEFPPLKVLPATLGNLPVLRTTFIGRETERRDLLKLLETNTLVTIVGTGGSGKTRLALEVAREAAPDEPGGAWVAELEALHDEEAVAHAVASAVGLRSDPERTTLETVVHGLTEKRLLLVVDNCEHVLEAIAGVVDAVLDRCPGVTVLATSREPLGVPGERVWRLPVLETPPSSDLPSEAIASFEGVRLFLDRASAARHDFTFGSHNAGAIAEICRRLDGIPLAIELAAARAGSVSPEDLVRRLDHRFGVIVGSSRRAVPRQQTLRALIEWSYDLLDEREQTFFDRLSVFEGGFTLDAAAAVAGEDIDADDAFDLVSALVDKSLVVVDDVDGATRYRLLETIRAFAAERLGERAAETRLAHLRWYRNMAAEARRGLQSRDQPAWLQRCEAERANLRAAMEWACGDPDRAEVALEMGSAIYRFWLVRGPVAEGFELLDAALEASSAPTPERAWALLRVASLAERQGDSGGARARQSQAVALARELGDVDLEALALNDIGVAARDAGDLETGADLGEEALVLARAGDGSALGTCLCNLGGTYLAASRHREARALLEEARAHLSRDGDVYGLSVATHNLGIAAFQEGDLEACRRFVTEARTLHQQLQDENGEGIVLAALAQVEQAEGDLEAADRAASAALAILREVGSPVSVSIVLGIVAEIRVGLGQDVSALLDEKLAWDTAAGFLAGEATALIVRAQLESRGSDLAAASATVADAVAKARESGNDAVVADALAAAGEVELRRSRHGEALAAYDEAASIYRRLGHKRAEVQTLEALKQVPRAE